MTPNIDDMRFDAEQDALADYMEWLANNPDEAARLEGKEFDPDPESMALDIPKNASEDQLREIYERLSEKIDETNNGMRHLSVLVKHILRTVNEINEEYKIDHPKFDMLVKMAKEWGVEDGFGDASPDKESN